MTPVAIRPLGGRCPQGLFAHTPLLSWPRPCSSIRHAGQTFWCNLSVQLALRLSSPSGSGAAWGPTFVRTKITEDPGARTSSAHNWARAVVATARNSWLARLTSSGAATSWRTGLRWYSRTSASTSPSSQDIGDCSGLDGQRSCDAALAYDLDQHVWQAELGKARSGQVGTREDSRQLLAPFP